MEKRYQQYLPVIASPPEHPVCESYFGNLIDTMNSLEISHIYIPDDEMEYSKLCHIILKNPKLYRSITILMGVFHQLFVRHRFQLYWYKRLVCQSQSNSNRFRYKNNERASLLQMHVVTQRMF